MEIKTKAKRWGGSIGVILPKSFIDSKKIRENDELIIEVKTQPVLVELFGKFPRKSKKTAQELKDEAKAGWN